MQPTLTIGLPFCADYRALWGTLAALHKDRLEHNLVNQVEILVGDNSGTIPDQVRGKKHSDLARQRVQELPNARYVVCEIKGTAPTKQEVVKQASGLFVAVMDAHCTLTPGTIRRLLGFCLLNPEDNNLHHAMECHLKMSDGIETAVVCSHRLATYGPDGNFGYCFVDPRGKDPHAEPFDVPSAGTGFFLVRKATWLGFHPDCRGWGGEESYIGEKYRQAGRRVIAHPAWGYAHQYGWVDGVPYNGNDWLSKARNELLGHKELNWPDVREIQKANVGAGRLKIHEFIGLIRELQIKPPAASPAVVPPSAAAAKQQNAEAPLLKVLPCPLRTRRSGEILCNMGCTASQQVAHGLYDCHLHGAVTLTHRRTDLKHCQGCIDRPGQRKNAEPIEIPDLSAFPEMRLSIGVLACIKNDEKRKAIRETWGSTLPDGVEIMFLIGDPALSETELRGDELWLPCKDDYDSLPYKTRGWCQWLLQNRNFARAFKCDDDTYVAVSRILETDKNNADFVGVPLHHAPYVPSGGAGYLLSQKAVAILARDMEAKTFAEDVEAYDALAAHGISLTPTHRFNAGHPTVPSPENNQITAHYVNPDLMRIIHSKFSKPVTMEAQE